MAAHTSRPGTKSNYDPSDDEKNHKHRKQHSGGEPKKTALKAHAEEEESEEEPREEVKGGAIKMDNIGPSGQGSHRGRESRHRQSKASGRSDVAADTRQGHPGA